MSQIKGQNHRKRTEQNRGKQSTKEFKTKFIKAHNEIGRGIDELSENFIKDTENKKELIRIKEHIN